MLRVAIQDGSAIVTHSMTSKAKHIPAEILAEIFYLSLTCMNSPRSRNETPLSVSQTCRFWRYVALSTSRLWDTLHANIDCHGLCSDQALRTLCWWNNILSAWLQRSRDRRLNFDIYVGIDRMEASTAVYRKSEEIVMMILWEKGRWGGSSFRFDDLCPTPSLQINLAMISSVSNLSFEFKYLNKKTVGAASTLTSLSIIGASNAKTTSDRNISNTISELWVCYEGLRFDAYLNLCLISLCYNANVTSIFFDHIPTVSRVDRSRGISPAICLPHLKELSFESDSLLDCNILDSIIAPSLEQLDIGVTSDRKHPYNPLSRYLYKFLRHSRPPIWRLNLRDFYLDEEFYLIQSLRILPTIRKLTLNGGAFSEAFWNALTLEDQAEASEDQFETSEDQSETSEDQSETLCPNLIEFEFLGQSSQTWHPAYDEHIPPMLVSRWRNSNDFKALIYIRTFDDDDDDPYTDFELDSSLEECVEEGFELDLCCDEWDLEVMQ